jgi:hypothetical protein
MEVWRLALARDPQPDELRAAVTYLEKQAKVFAGQTDPARKALVSLCHVLLNTNEFIYVD